MPMTATRRDLIRLMVDLVHATQCLVRATEENTRISRSLRADIARMKRRAPTRRPGRPRGSLRRPKPAVDRGPRLRLVSGGRRETREAGMPRAPLGSRAGEPGVAVIQRPPRK